MTPWDLGSNCSRTPESLRTSCVHAWKPEPSWSVDRKSFCHVGVSVAGLPCNRPQTLQSTSAGGKVRRFAAPLCCCHLAERRPKNWKKRFQALLGYQKFEWRWCHGSNGLVSSVLGGCYAPWMSAFTMQGSNQRRRTASQPSWTPDALRLRFGLPTCVSLQPPAKFPPCPACLAVLPSNPPSLSSNCPDCPLIPAPALLVQHHDTAAQLEHTSNIIPESATLTAP